MNRSSIFDKAFKVFSYFLCICFAIYFTIQCIQHFMLDEDVTQIEYRKFHDDSESIYPSITYCIKNPVVPKERQSIWLKYGKNDTTNLRKDYLKYLSGLSNSDAFTESDYDVVSKKLENFLKEVEIVMDANTFVTWNQRNGTLTLVKAIRKFKTERDSSEPVIENLSNQEKEKFPDLKFYITQKSGKEKCYTFDVPFMENVQVNSFILRMHPYRLFGIKFKENIERIKPKQYESSYRMYFHYPHQKLLAMSSSSGFQSSLDISLQYNRQHWLKSIEVLRRRDKRSHPCISDYEYDEKIIKETIESFGCKLPNIDPRNNASICKDKMLSSKFFNALYKKQHHPPCHRIQTINIMDKEYETFEKKKDNDEQASKIIRKLNHRINFEDNYFKEMIYIKDYTFLSLFANAGGYIGKLSEIQNLKQKIRPCIIFY